MSADVARIWLWGCRPCQITDTVDGIDTPSSALRAADLHDAETHKRKPTSYFGFLQINQPAAVTEHL